jgi:hypothetical protein
MMGILPNPWVLLGALAMAIGAYFYGHHEGYAQKEGEDAVVIAEKNRQMEIAKDDADEKLKDAQQQLTVAQGKLRDSIRSGDQRLYVRVATPTECSSTAGGNSTTTAQLDPVFADSLVAITDRGDQAIVQLNSCIAEYNKMREIVNANN